MSRSRFPRGNRYLRAWAPYVLAAAAVYLLPFLLGVVAGAERPGGPFVPVRGPAQPPVDIQTVPLFVHNLRITLILAAGFLLGGLPTVYGLAVNGLVHGSVLDGAAASLGPAQALALFVPHGVIELPALWLGAAVSFRWVHYVWKVAGGDRDRVGFPRLFAESTGVLALVAAMLLFAAVVEANLTAALA